MSPIATADVARIVVRMLTDGSRPGLYHVVNAGAADLVRICARNHPARGGRGHRDSLSTGEYPVRAARPRYSVLDNAKVSAAFGAMPQWQDALDRYLHAKGYSGR